MENWFRALTEEQKQRFLENTHYAVGLMEGSGVEFDPTDVQFDLTEAAIREEMTVTDYVDCHGCGYQGQAIRAVLAIQANCHCY